MNRLNPVPLATQTHAACARVCAPETTAKIATTPLAPASKAITAARLPAPVHSKPTTVPADHGLGPDDLDCAQYRRREPVQPNQSQAIRIREPQSLRQLADEDAELLTKHQILGFEPGARFEPHRAHTRAVSATQPSRAKMPDPARSVIPIQFSVTTAISCRRPPYHATYRDRAADRQAGAPSFDLRPWASI